ncbi:hypothetical protein [Miltoncostaea oceani]|uniref:hypothetical protein n=1 Tax=Miltoncostaea oceani TaxID=2843216 RepID=UPI001C3C911E|nr:hypothetical protein [Miltoncostaea oceani]
MRLEPLTVVADLSYAPKLMEISFRLAEIELRETSHHDMEKAEFEAAETALRRARIRYSAAHPRA